MLVYIISFLSSSSFFPSFSPLSSLSILPLSHLPLQNVFPLVLFSTLIQSRQIFWNRILHFYTLPPLSPQLTRPQKSPFFPNLFAELNGAFLCPKSASKTLKNTKPLEEIKSTTECHRAVWHFVPRAAISGTKFELRKVDVSHSLTLSLCVFLCSRNAPPSWQWRQSSKAKVSTPPPKATPVMLKWWSCR